MTAAKSKATKATDSSAPKNVEWDDSKLRSSYANVCNVEAGTKYFLTKVYLEKHEI